MSSSPPELRLEHPRPDDAGRVLECLVAFDEHMLGESEWDETELALEWRRSRIDRDVWIALEGERVVGYLGLEKRNEVWEFDGYVHPARFGRGIGSRLVELGVDEARRRGSALVRTAVLGDDAPAHALLEARGFSVVRRFYRMRVELARKPPAPSWPDGLSLSPFDLARDDARPVWEAVEDSFRDHWNTREQTYAQWLDEQPERGRADPWGWIVVRDADEVAAVTILDRERFGGGWIATVGVRRPWRRRGLGEAMLNEAFGRFWAAGTPVVGLGVDAQSETGATRLYERVGMHVAFSATFFERELA